MPGHLNFYRPQSPGSRPKLVHYVAFMFGVILGVVIAFVALQLRASDTYAHLECNSTLKIEDSDAALLQMDTIDNDTNETALGIEIVGNSTEESLYDETTPAGTVEQGSSEHSAEHDIEIDTDTNSEMLKQDPSLETTKITTTGAKSEPRTCPCPQHMELPRPMTSTTPSPPTTTIIATSAQAQPPRTRAPKSTEGYRLPIHDHSIHPCVKFELLVTPAEIGLNHIFQPRILDLGYCAGMCPFPIMSTGIDHTIHGYFLDQFRLHYRAKYLPATCCVPVAYKDISALVSGNNGRYTSTTLRNASVLECGCR